jgi:putative PIN family toxin of toxin-antitoxin system
MVAGLLARDGAPARLLLRWLAGDFELIISDQLITELTHALSYRKVRSRVPTEDASECVAMLEANAMKTVDPGTAPRRSRDPGDDYLLALAASSSAIVVSGDRDLLALGADLPIYSPSEFLAVLDQGSDHRPE